MNIRLFCIACFLCLIAAPLRAGDPADGTTAFPTFGISLIPPAGWVRGPEEPSRGLIAQWGVRAGAGGKIDAAIIVDFSHIRNQTLLDYAKTRAQATGATVSPEPALLGDSPALRLTAGPRADRTQQLEMLLAVHDGYVYGVTLLGGKQQLDPTLLAVARSWKWIPFESPANHLELRAGPVPILRGIAVIDIPMVMRPLPIADGGVELHLGAYNFSRGDIDFSVDVQVLGAVAGKSFPELAEAFGRGLADRVKLDQPIVWKRDEPGRVVSQLVTAAMPLAGEPDHKNRVQWALIDLGDSAIALVSITVSLDADAGERDNYEATAVKMIASLRRAPKRPVTPKH